MRLTYIWAKFIKKIQGAAIKNSTIHPTSKVEAGSQFVNSSMGKYSFCGYDCDINDCSIGCFCSIANNVVIGGGAHPINWASTSPVFYNNRDSVKKKFSRFEREPHKQTIVGNDVWIGRSAILMQGLTIGDGAVIGAGAVVTKDVEPYTIVAGCPARIIRKRFSEDVIEGLLASAWWDLNDIELEACASRVKSPKDFIEAVKEVRK
jgi:acetyltransferase-like isoleucine patch superfamily enzyme